MDPISQGVLGGTASQFAAADRPTRRKVILLGILSGMAPDLDVLIRSSTDPLLALEYHRQFTHSLFFIPLGALVCAVVFYVVWRSLALSFKRVYLVCFLGYATHALLDACTTYGTQLLWPLSSIRVAWNTLSVVDPLFTLPMLAALLGSYFSRSTRRINWFGKFALLWLVFYLGCSLVQHQRAESYARQLADSRGHGAVDLEVKPSFANIVVFKSVYTHDDRFYVDAIRAGFAPSYYLGRSTPRLNIKEHFPWLDKASQQAIDIKRFAWFSNNYLGLDPSNKNRIIDIRYSLIPNRLDGMWGISLNKNVDRSAHVVWTTNRPAPSQMQGEVANLWSMIIGRQAKLLPR